MKSFSVLHSYNGGDLIAMMAGLAHCAKRSGRPAVIYQRLNMPAYYYEGAEHPIRDGNGEMVTMNKATFDLMKPLVEWQPYVEKFKQYKGETVDIDLDASRDRKLVPLPAGDLHFWTTMVAPQFAGDYGERWLHFPPLADNPHKGKIVINRTSRWPNNFVHYYFLRPYADQIVFVGLEQEWRDFCTKWEISVEYQPVVDFLHLAQLIGEAKFFMGNQSLCWHIAEGLKVKRILESCPAVPNVFPKGKDGYLFVYQEALEYYFNLLNQD